VVDHHKVVYSNFHYFTRFMGTSKTPEATLAVNDFPNPTTGNIQVGFTGESSKPLTATISDITGKALLTRTFSNTEARSMNLETLPKGVYLLRLESEHGTAVKRIVKQ
ncbi:MAG TPA: T9SS type A sorting domain-containing protein, partial [Adhaeribacter sp.]|nr:T9SS type A sorting domain-containing protein [Adhaeribacter sp.]